MSTTPSVPPHLTDFPGVLLVVLLQRVEQPSHPRIRIHAQLCHRSRRERTPGGQRDAKTFQPINQVPHDPTILSARNTAAHRQRLPLALPDFNLSARTKI
jgi:hypothetical protein